MEVSGHPDPSSELSCTEVAIIIPSGHGLDDACAVARAPSPGVGDLR
jgi:hypothetical protein